MDATQVTARHTYGDDNTSRKILRRCVLAIHWQKQHGLRYGRGSNGYGGTSTFPLGDRLFPLPRELREVQQSGVQVRFI